jgi:hypothetical protein
MTFTNYSIIPSDKSVTIDNTPYLGVDMAGIPGTVQAIHWDGIALEGTIEYSQLPNGTFPPSGSFTNPDDYYNQTQACLDPLVCYATTIDSVYLGQTVNFSQELIIRQWPHPAVPSGFTILVPPIADAGQVLYWYSSIWIVSSFNPSSTLPQAKSKLISQVTRNGAAAVNTQLGLYSNPEQILTADVLALDCVSYPGTTIGDYQTYVDGLIASSTATINAAVSTTALYSFNPADVPFRPAAYGTISGSRTGNDFNNSYYVTFYSNTLIEDDTELFIPATSTVIPYILPNQFNGFSEAFTTGNYLVQIRQSSTGFVLAEYICPAGPPDVVVSF